MKKINLNNLIGKKYNKLTILEAWRDEKSQIIVKCKCECGNIKNCRYDALYTKQTKSCGCLQKQIVSKIIIKTRTIHGQTYTRLYQIWLQMKQRCYNSKNRNYKNYGARKIIICNEWKNDFINFYNWSMNNGYNDNLSIDRINVNGNYEPNNCRWITQKEQNNNTRHNHYITINNETKTLAEWCEIYNIKYKLVLKRINQLKWNPLKALTIPIRKQSIILNNKQRLYNIWANMKDRCYNTNCKDYKNYGARGITICDKWKDNFENFKEWALKNGYKDNLSIDRIDVNGNYEPNNCNWSTMKKQANNRRNNCYITINGETKTLTEWCEQYDINYKTVHARINQLKWDPLKALTIPIFFKKLKNK